MRSVQTTEARKLARWNLRAVHFGTRSVFIILFVCSAFTFVGSLVVHAQTPKTYYVDCTGGVDTNPGTSTSQAWKSIAKANGATLQPGDKLLFKKGCAWQGPLKAVWNGTAALPITIGAYGTGNLPIIQDAYSSAVQITGSYQIIEYLETTLTTPPSPDANCSNQPVAWKLGFVFGNASSYNTVQYSKANHLAIGIFFDYNSHHNRALHNEITDNNVVWKLDATQALGAMGILLHGDNHEIGFNYFANNKTICTYNGTVESNSIEVHGARFAKIHHNTSYNDRVFSELGSSSTYPSNDNTFAYNLHVVGTQTPSSQVGPRFIVTRGQGHANGPVWRTIAYNNTVVLTGLDSKGIACQNCGSDVLIAKNNIFWVDREPISSDGPFIEEYNVFWASTGSPLLNFSKSLTSKIINPTFVDASTNDFRLQSTSSARDAGTLESVSAGYNADMNLVVVPQATSVDVGAFELPSATPPNPTPSPTPSPTPTPLPTCTISINDGALYTGAREVQVKVNVLDATQMMISSDAGFANATSQPYQSQFAWTLPDTGSRIATLLIYVRFTDIGGQTICGSQIGDDIIYDPQPPTVTVALAEGSSVTGGQEGVPNSSAIVLSIRASDQENGSGVELMQISLEESFSDPIWQPYSEDITVSATPGQTIYVRVKDGSGNVSPTASITLPPSAESANEIFIPHVSR